MPIFLHFLNREAYRAAETRYVLEKTMYWLRILTIARHDPLYSNFSNLAESGCLAADGPALVQHLIRGDQLLVVGERPSLAEFVESRAPRYSHDAERYPMYFRSERRFHDIRPVVLRAASDTDNLQNVIEGLANHCVALSDIGLIHTDVSLLGPAISTLWKVIQERGARGITRSLFAGKLNTYQEECAAARLISTAYIRRHLIDLKAEIVAGIPELAVFDRLCEQPLFSNVNVLQRICNAAGFGALLLFSEEHDYRYVVLRGQPSHIRFASQIELLCRVFGRMERKGPLPHKFVHGLIQQAAAKQPMLDPQCSFLFEAAEMQVAKIVDCLRSVKNFEQAYEEQMEDKDKTTILIVTATKTETQALLDVSRDFISTSPRYLAQRDYIAIDLGYLNGIRILNVQCEPGSVGPASSQAVITDAIRDLKPTAVLLAGIAFGAKEDKQRLGDILVSKMIIEYERAKVGETCLKPRGQRVEASPKLLSLLRAADAARFSGDLGVHVGLMLSGEKLVDSSEFRAQLLAAEPEAIGGEMEGAGLIAAAVRSKIDWIVVKAIVDWGLHKSDNNDPDQQTRAARGALLFVLRAISEIGF